MADKITLGDIRTVLWWVVPASPGRLRKREQDMFRPWIEAYVDFTSSGNRGKAKAWVKLVAASRARKTEEARRAR
jgi:hypothetical protein